MKIYAVDASFILGALLEEDKKVVSIFSRIFDEVVTKRTVVYSSQLLPLEVANVIRYKFKDSETGNEVYEKFYQLPVCYFNLDINQIKQALFLAYSVSGSVYDASYHLVARLQGGTLLTCDKEYFIRANNIGSIKYIE